MTDRPADPDRLPRRAFLAGAAALAAAPAAAQEAPPAGAPAETPPPPAPPPPRPKVVLQTTLGRIVIELAPDKAPVTAANFLRYVDAKRFDGAAFYRAQKNPWGPDTGIVQGGVRNDPAKSFKPIAHEPTSKTGLSHKDGAVSMARYAPGTATSEFFICLGDNSGLDQRTEGQGDLAGFAVFGQVVEGMETARAVFGQPTDPSAGQGVVKGQMLAKPVRIATARRAP